MHARTYEAVVHERGVIRIAFSHERAKKIPLPLPHTTHSSLHFCDAIFDRVNFSYSPRYTQIEKEKRVTVVPHLSAQ
ncbi:hypothetical protein POVWA2_031240 [Plasmodium ovale wallikeri]|uniref:Uncharacterized protein n=1 Tax=Plasmodium ovale wallikeri TaxID=864142 RepID=A0A1A8YXJ3_PLAOA|nr:hypothetical protein POVWA1_031520 [Plasmodium ovale wallikeri]SBT36645.1 hypothetical protein POVWA2_031240 [Plasmodium ovale wallikeri]